MTAATVAKSRAATLTVTHGVHRWVHMGTCGYTYSYACGNSVFTVLVTAPVPSSDDSYSCSCVHRLTLTLTLTLTLAIVVVVSTAPVEGVGAVGIRVGFDVMVMLCCNTVAASLTVISYGYKSDSRHTQEHAEPVSAMSTEPSLQVGRGVRRQGGHRYRMGGVTREP